MYTIPAEQYRSEEIIKKSKFITTIAHGPTVEDAKNFIALIQQEFSDASHNCWAFVAGPPGDSARVGMSDDGEPHGTAGKPMLSLLLHSGVGEIVVVVTRYFGGTKLGKGGLVRAYSGAVKNGLSGLSVKEKIEKTCLSVTVDYSRIEPVKKLLTSFNAEIIGEKYLEDVSLKIEFSKNHEESLIQAIKDLTAGKSQIVTSG